MSRKTEIQVQVQKPMETKVEKIEDLPGVGPATAEKLRDEKELITTAELKGMDLFVELSKERKVVTF